MTLFHSPSVQSPAAYSNQNLAGNQLVARMALTPSAGQRLNFVTAIGDTGWNYKIAAEETAYGLLTGNISYGFAQTDMRRFAALVLDCVTDNTAALVAAFTTPLLKFRGTISIPYGCKFNRTTVYAAVPVGIIVVDMSSVNTGQPNFSGGVQNPAGYNNKSIIYYTNDSVSDDAQHGFVSGHHPSIRLNNTHTSGTGSAAGSFHSLLFAHGFKNTNDAIDGMQMLVSKSTAGNSWRCSWVLNTAYVDAATAVPWVTATVYGAGARVYTADGGVWTTVAGGTAGPTQPNGVGPNFNDGTVAWVYQNVWSQGSTRFYFDPELGKGEIIGVGQQVWRVSTTITQGLEMGCNDATGDMWLTDQHRGKDLVRANTANGWTRTIPPSLDRGGALTGAIPQISNELHTVTNAGATNMTGVTVANSQTRICFYLYFTNANTTLKATGFALKGGVDVTPAAGSLMRFMIDTGLSANPIEMQRNF